MKRPFQGGATFLRVLRISAETGAAATRPPGGTHPCRGWALRRGRRLPLAGQQGNFLPCHRVRRARACPALYSAHARPDRWKALQQHA